MKLVLNKVKNRINIYDYSLKEIAEYFEKFDRNKYIITAKNNIYYLIVRKEFLPHMLGIHHAFKNDKFKRLFKGKRGFETIKNGNLSIEDIRRKIRECNSEKIWNMIKMRMEYLPMFFNTLLTNTNLKIMDRTKFLRESKLKGDLALYKKLWNIYPILSLKKINESNLIIETFIVEMYDDLLKLIENEEIIKIELVKNNKIFQKS